MNVENLKKCGICYEDGLHRFCDSAAMYEKHLRRLPNLDLFCETQTAILNDDAPTAFANCHKLKAYIGNLSIPGLYAEICTLTDLLRSGTMDNKAVVSAQFDKVNALYQTVVNTILEESSCE